MQWAIRACRIETCCNCENALLSPGISKARDIFLTSMLQETSSPSRLTNLKFTLLHKNEILLPTEVIRTFNLGLQWKVATNEKFDKDNCDPESITKLQSS